MTGQSIASYIRRAGTMLKTTAATTPPEKATAGGRMPSAPIRTDAAMMSEIPSALAGDGIVSARRASGTNPNWPANSAASAGEP